MDHRFGHAYEKVLTCMLSIAITLSFLFCTPAGAYIYDNFDDNGINSANWYVSDPGGLFSQPGNGQLYFYSDNSSGLTPPPAASLISTTFFTPGFFSMDFNSFFSSNNSPGGQGLGSFAALGIGTKDTSYVRMLRGRVVSDEWGYFEANYFDGADLHVWYVYADAVSGQLGLYYDGSGVKFFYNNGLHGWQEVDTTGPDTKGRILTVTPGWIAPPPLFISGTPGASGVTGFEVDKVEYTALPEPATMLLLGSGLLGLWGIRREFKK